VSRPRNRAASDPQVSGRSGARNDRTRFTLDLERRQHRFLKQFALDAETDASAVMRVLLRLLQEDDKLARRVLARLTEEERP
jgi:hypothetical protein